MDRFAARSIHAVYDMTLQETVACGGVSVPIKKKEKRNGWTPEILPPLRGHCRSRPVTCSEIEKYTF